MSELIQANKISFNTKETCQILSINRNLLDSFRKKGLIKYVKMGRQYVYPKTEIENFINRNIGKEITKEGYIL